MSGRALLAHPVRAAAIVLACAAVFFMLGSPRWTDHGIDRAGARTAAGFAKLCRSHGGTPAAAAAPGGQVCTVRYGHRVYRMDAVTPDGFDADTAKYQRQGCDAARQGGDATTRETFVYHAATGVCERRP